jgi:XapX domain-containing protein
MRAPDRIQQPKAIYISAGRLRPRKQEVVMTGYLVSLLMGLVVGAAYGLVHVRAPAPPLIALVGLLGIVLGQQAVEIAKRRSAAPAQTSIQRSTEQ